MQLGRLNVNEKRMLRSLYKTKGKRITKKWCLSKTRTHAHILVGRLKRNPYSVDHEVSFETITIPVKQPIDPLSK